jgi:hypothetical protein
LTEPTHDVKTHAAPAEGAEPDQFVKRVVQVIELLAFFSFSPALVIPFVALDRVHLGDQAGRLAASPVFRGDLSTLPNRPVDVGSAIPMNEGHAYYTFAFAPRGASRFWMQ